MTRDCSQLTNFVNKFLGTVKFGNDHVAKILGYGDYQIGNVTNINGLLPLRGKSALNELVTNQTVPVSQAENTYHGWIDEDVVNHIAKVLEMVDLIHVLGVDSHQLRMKVFPLSLTDDAWQWWKNEGEGKITIWEELVEKLFCKFYPESYDGEEEILDEGDN
ncbi:hypothetical protein Tco_0679696 [Tanacetum coccineum]|uniref:Integrase, catalytic region, zinc finger, CCHC-type, peptidase aspartic, catalytic n=1 Tax=Tanacetum coccineum TaxID=301880 RepID=A0ABQ4XIN8_9ASTR